MNVKTARDTIVKFLIDHNGTATSAECEAAVRAGATDDAAKKAAKSAFNNASYVLKQRGCVKGTGRGQWAITDAGREFAETGNLPEAQEKASNGTPAAAPEHGKADTADGTATEGDGTTTEGTTEGDGTTTEGTTEGDGTTAAPAPPAPAKRVKVASVTATGNPVVPAWLADENLRGMVIEASDCFSAWSAKSHACADCPLAGWCRNAKASTLTLLASRLTTTTPEAPAPVTKAAVKLDNAVSVGNASNAPRVASKPEGGVMRAPQDGVCSKTGAPIKKGDQVIYVKDLGLCLASAVTA
jgi:hypothetical protein